MTDEKTNNWEDGIHLEDYTSEYEHDLATSDTLLFTNSRKTISLNGEWNYAIDQYDACIRQKWFLENSVDNEGYSLPLDYSFDEWPTMNLPCCWNTQSSELKLYEGTIVFNKKFELSVDEFKNKKVFLYIGAVNIVARIFLNKNYIGMHRGGSTPFCIEVTKYLTQDGKLNRILIAADNTRRPEQVPCDNTDWFNYGGVYRNIELIILPESYIKNMQVSLVNDELYNKIKVSFEVYSETLTNEARVKFNINEISIIEMVTLQKETDSNILKGTLTIKNKKISLWSPDNPKLYEVNAQLFSSLSDTNIIDEISDEVGFREIKVKDKKIYLNGQEIFLKGVCSHEESVQNGKALTDDERTENFKLAKDLGCNFMRLAHYPHHENASRLADKLGLLLWEEIPVYWAIKFSRLLTYKDAENQLCELIKRDFNRASVIIWSVGNENADTDERLNFMSNLANKAHQVDETRLVSAACLVDNVNNKISDRLTEYLDIIGLNEYFGWYNPHFELLPLLLQNSSPDKPVIITEFGADALPGLHGDSEVKGNEEYQEYVYKEQTKYLGETEYVCGMTPWILYDFRCPRRTSNIQGYYNRKGLLSPGKKDKKKAYYVLQEFYSSKK